MKWLNKCNRYTNIILGSHLRHSFGIPLIPQAFLKFGGLIKACHGSYSFEGGRGCCQQLELCLNSSLHLLFMVFVTQMMSSELVFQTSGKTICFTCVVIFKT
jgi:hypothetical protein